MPTTVAEKFGVVHLPILPIPQHCQLSAAPAAHLLPPQDPSCHRPATASDNITSRSDFGGKSRSRSLSATPPIHKRQAAALSRGDRLFGAFAVLWFSGPAVTRQRTSKKEALFFFVLFALRHRLLLLNPAAQKLQHHTLDHSPPLDSFQSSPWLSI